MKRTEEQFIAAIDCCFPYGDMILTRQLIREAASISVNALATVVYELVYLPVGAEVSKPCLAESLKLVGEVTSSLAIRRLVDLGLRSTLSSCQIVQKDLLAALNLIRLEEGLFVGLAVVWALADSDEEHEAVEQESLRITTAWKERDSPDA